jgi:hypothetical protein
MAAVLSIVLGVAQVPIHLTNDHPIVIEHLIGLHDGLSKHIAARNAEDPENAQSRLAGAARIFGVSAEGYQRLTGILSAAKVRLEGVRSSQSQYTARIASAKTMTARDRTALQGFYEQQNTVLRSVPLDLQAGLSPSDWTSLRVFIETELVGKIRVGTLTNPKP